MSRHLKLFAVLAAALLVPAAAEAHVCKARIAVTGVGQGIFGEGTENARFDAIQKFEALATSRYGARYGVYTNARSPYWTCKKGALLQAKCVLSASPCR